MKSLSRQRKLTVGLLMMCALSGCSQTNVMYLKPGYTKTVQLRETVKGAKVWVKDSSGVKIPAKADLLESGFYRFDLTLDRK